jgi:hypothetical protein
MRVILLRLSIPEHDSAGNPDPVFLLPDRARRWPSVVVSAILHGVVLLIAAAVADVMRSDYLPEAPMNAGRQVMIRIPARLFLVKLPPRSKPDPPARSHHGPSPEYSESVKKPVRFRLPELRQAKSSEGEIILLQPEYALDLRPELPVNMPAAVLWSGTPALSAKPFVAPGHPEPARAVTVMMDEPELNMRASTAKLPDFAMRGTAGIEIPKSPVPAQADPVAVIPGGLNAGRTSGRVDHPPDGQFDMVVTQTSLAELFPESNLVMGGRPIYTVYLQVGDSKEWILHYSAMDSRTVQTGSVVKLGDPRPLAAPYPQVTFLPGSIPSAPTGNFVFVHGLIDETGKLKNLRVIGQKITEPETFLATLMQWNFRPAHRGPDAAAVEILLVIPARQI